MSAENGIGAVTGTIDGAGYRQLTSEMKQFGSQCLKGNIKYFNM